jgi:hypothetical protein
MKKLFFIFSAYIQHLTKRLHLENQEFLYYVQALLESGYINYNK